MRVPQNLSKKRKQPGPNTQTLTMNKDAAGVGQLLPRRGAGVVEQARLESA